MLVLQDGTRTFLNTDTRVVVRFDKQARPVELKNGEALFEVAKQAPSWPFVVVVDGRRVTALGTALVVRRGSGRVSVTLVEGSVAVLPTKQRSAPSIPLMPG